MALSFRIGGGKSIQKDETAVSRQTGRSNDTSQKSKIWVLEKTENLSHLTHKLDAIWPDFNVSIAKLVHSEMSHKTSCTFTWTEQTLVSSRRFGVIFKLSFGDHCIVALRGRTQPVKKPSQSQEGHFPKKMNSKNDTKTLELSKSATGNICDHLWHLLKHG